jgi:hypothetical protein
VGAFLGDDQRLVFVGGLHRSGTTLLARLIADHPHATGLAGTGVPEDEGQHVQDVYPPAEALGGSGRFARHADAHLTEESPLARPENAQRLWDAWRPFWDSDAECLVEKSPPNLLMSRYLQALFPSASFLFIVRHPVTVTLATRKWRRRTPLPRLMGHWFTAHATARDDLPSLTRVHVVRPGGHAGGSCAVPRTHGRPRPQHDQGRQQCSLPTAVARDARHRQTWRDQGSRAVRGSGG